MKKLGEIAKEEILRKIDDFREWLKIEKEKYSRWEMEREAQKQKKDLGNA